MPVARVYPLQPERDALLPAFLGRAAHAAVYRALHAVDPALATRLHEATGPRPFTVSVLEEGIRSGRRETPARAGEPLHLRVTLLEDDLLPLIEQALAPGTALELGHLRSTVGQPAAEHPLAGQVTYEELLAMRLFPGVALPSRLRLRFLSPTTFHQRDRHLPVPLPRLVFASLTERWNAFAPVTLAPEIVQGTEDLLVGAYELRTRLVDTGQGKVVGFVGWCEYRLEAVEPAVAAAAATLATFSFYAGVGHKTAMGLGQTVLVPRRGPP